MNFDLNSLIVILLSLLIALTLHEYAHALVGYWLGDKTAKLEGRLSLNPLAHIDPFTTLALPLMLILLHSPVIFAAAKPVPFNPHQLRGGRWGAALVAAAGPAMNFLLALLFAGVMWVVPMTSAVATLFVTIIIMNVGLGTFNLIPFPPLDGSRVLYAAVPPLRDIMDRIESLGMIWVFVIFIFGYPFIAPYIAQVIYFVVNLIVPVKILP
jgi:Zn-dependent protease